jgi:hypothetical protein
MPRVADLQDVQAMTPNYTTTQQPASTEAPAGSSDKTLPVGGAEALPLVGGKRRAYIAIGDGYIALVDKPVDPNCWVDL